MGYLLGYKGMGTWKSSYWEDNTEKGDPDKEFDNLKAVFKTSNTQFTSYHEQAYNLQKHKDNRVEQLDICLTKGLPKCSYPRDQVDNGTVWVLFNKTKYFKIKWFVRKEPLILT